jgi:2-polyprenyl-3-methyl-5-hydroxy-6-metoxy-1,4-benzoquinol methylase
MRVDRIEWLACPDCGGQLTLRDQALAEDDPGEVREGSLDSACGRSFAITGHVARFVPIHNYADSFGFQWAQHAKTQIDVETGYNLSRERFRTATTWENLAGKRVLEAGCGAGRFTSVALELGAELVTFDYSTAIDVNVQNSGLHDAVTYLQADIYRIPVRPASFDAVFCMGVLQHTPDVRVAFMSLADVVKPGGELVIDVYKKTLPAMLHWKYVLRPITKRMDPRRLHRLVEIVVPPLLPVWKVLHRLFGRAGTRLLPITSYSQLGISDSFNREWSVLDTFDMYSPAYDNPQTIKTVRGWFEQAGFEDIVVAYGPNGIVGRGHRPDARSHGA